MSDELHTDLSRGDRVIVFGNPGGNGEKRQGVVSRISETVHGTVYYVWADSAPAGREIKQHPVNEQFLAPAEVAE